MEYLRPVRWKEGMFLRPHHLQQFDLFRESQEIAYLHALEHYGWGLIRLELQEDSLNNFVLAVKSMRAVMADGTLVDVPGNARLPSRPIDRSAAETGRELEVSVGLRRLEERRPQAVATNGGTPGQARFLVVNEDVYDVDAGRDPVTVERLEYDLRFILGDEPTHGYETLPIARLVGTGDPSRPVRPTRGYAPPSMIVSASPVLHGTARAVVERLATSLRDLDLNDARRGDDVDNLILYHALSSCLPVLRDMVMDGMVHPRRVYQEMARLAGALLYRDSERRSCDDIPGYDHLGLGPVFERLRKLIQELSELIFVRNWRRLSMERLGDEFRVSLPSEVKKPGVRCFLQVLAEESTPRVKQLLMTAKTSAPARIDTLKKFVLPGISTEAQPGPPPELPATYHSGTFFRLKLEDGNEWTAHVMPAGELSASILNAPQDLSFFLVAILPAG